ncbi:MAG TPA: rhomboid family intramembrane serine protease [Myxococcota bacterium]|jgi:membrane associated rhomboid family serine protease
MVSTRRFGQMSPTPVVIVTLVVLLIMYLVTGFAPRVIPSAGSWYETLSLDADGVVHHGEVWRLLTYGLIHDLRQPTHLLFNAMWLFFFGRDLELRFGRTRFIAFLLAAVVVGGLFVVGGWALGIGSGSCLGFSAACEACVVAWALWNRNATVNLFFAFPIRGIWLLAFSVVMWMLDAVSQSQISASAHFGGIIFGVVVWFLGTRRNRIRLFVDELLMKLRLRRGPKLTVVPRHPDRWVN